MMTCPSVLRCRVALSERRLYSGADVIYHRIYVESYVHIDVDVRYGEYG